MLYEILESKLHGILRLNYVTSGLEYAVSDTLDKLILVRKALKFCFVNRRSKC